MLGWPGHGRTTIPDQTYAQRIKQQIEQYRHVENIHELPDIFHFWSGNFVRPRMLAVFEGKSIFGDVYADQIAQSFKRTGNRSVLSLGAGDGGTEIDIAKRLVAAGERDFVITCSELSDLLIGRGVEAAKREGVADHIRFLQKDINAWQPSERYAVCMANQSLHHFENLEHVFDMVAGCMEQDGRFLSNDTIGRNGHLRWPETRWIVDAIWASMPEAMRFNRGLNRLESPHFLDWDCSGEGFEGVRAEDILPMLVQRFGFTHLAAWGGFIDVFVDRSFGHNFDLANPAHKRFIHELAVANDALLRAGVIKPTQMFAVMTLDKSAACRTYEEMTPQFAVRQPASAPAAF
jgi:SAM-dependent methyltransferase